MASTPDFADRWWTVDRQAEYDRVFGAVGGPTARAQQVWDLYEAGDHRWKYLATELTEEDFLSVPDHRRPALKMLYGRAVADDPYVWIDPWEGRNV